MPARMVGMTSPGAVLSNDSQPPALPLRPKPEGLLEPLGIGRPHLRIDDAGRALAVERHDELLGGDAAHIGARLARHARGVGARDHVVELQQRMVGRRRLLVPHVEAGAGDLFCAQRLGERALVMYEAARRGDEIGVRLHQRELARADHAAGSFVERAVDRHEVGAPQQLVERHLDGAARGDRLLVEIGIAGDDLHAEETAAELGDAAADIADADDADRAPLDVIADEDTAVEHRAAPQGGLVWMICFESISTMASTCVATASALPPVWLTTSTPASVQSLTLMVSKPAPLVEMMSRFGMRASKSRWI